MDLAEIRKKARQQPLQVDNGEGHLSAPGADAISDLTLPSERQHEVDPAAQGLQQFFPDLDFASEEEYVQGLGAKESAQQGETVQWLTFVLGEEEYALTLDVVLELIRPRNYTELPHVPGYVCGILSLRGEVVPVIDLTTRLQLTSDSDGVQSRIVVCSGEEQSIGLLVDRITQVVRIPKDAIEPAPLALNDRGNFVSGVGRFQERMLILLNPDEVLKI